jgi:hypothetical protein
MQSSTGLSPHQRPPGLAVFAVVNVIGLIFTVAFWSLVYFKRLVPLPGDLSSLPERTNAAVTYGFMIGDLLFSVPLLFLAAIGIWRMRVWGWAAGQMVNILWLYSMTVILFRDAHSAFSPGGLLFIPFALVALWAIPYLWFNRGLFGVEEKP